MILSYTFCAGVYVINWLFTPEIAQEVLTTIFKDSDMAADSYSMIMEWGPVWGIAALFLFWEMTHHNDLTEKSAKALTTRGSENE